MLTFIAETREYLWGGLRSGDRPSGLEVSRHIGGAVKALPAAVKRIRARADSGFYCWEAVQACEKVKCLFILQVVMLAYNLNCWLMLFNREGTETAETLRHTTLATARLRFLFVAAKIWRHAGRTGLSYADHYEEKGIFNRLKAARSWASARSTRLSPWPTRRLRLRPRLRKYMRSWV